MGMSLYAIEIDKFKEHEYTYQRIKSFNTLKKKHQKQKKDTRASTTKNAQKNDIIHWNNLCISKKNYNS